MKSPAFNPIELVKDQFTALQERLEREPDPRKRNILHKRLSNLRGVMEFLRSWTGCEYSGSR